ncbi:peptidoglycan-binding domain-containing protein [Streptomyces sp. Da 82-17]|uniref:peptidoglycan-binding domain-containing protein n=1 Tax=Streptomyces sp. Da 82-17 TaxID=3377116 RepID=UPI0038D4BCD5
MSALSCPQCGTPRAAHGGPACGCARRTADAVRDTRSAEAAAAEDFDLLRLRPYVSLPEAPEPDGPAAGTAPATADAPKTPTAETATAPLLPPEGPMLPPKGPMLPPEEPNSATAPPLPETKTPHRPAGKHHRPRRKTLLAATAAALTVTAVAATATTLFSDAPEHEYALPDHPTTAPTTARTATQPTSRTPSPSRSPKAVAEASRSGAERPTRSGTPTRTAPVTPEPPTASATGSIGTPRSPRPPVLREGDEGPEVRELQNRLSQRYFYAGPEHGRYDVLVEDAVARYQYAEGITGDPQGVYGPATRRALEAETREPDGTPSATASR